MIIKSKSIIVIEETENEFLANKELRERANKNVIREVLNPENPNIRAGLKTDVQPSVVKNCFRVSCETYLVPPADMDYLKTFIKNLRADYGVLLTLDQRSRLNDIFRNVDNPVISEQ